MLPDNEQSASSAAWGGPWAGRAAGAAGGGEAGLEEGVGKRDRVTPVSFEQGARQAGSEGTFHPQKSPGTWLLRAPSP